MIKKAVFSYINFGNDIKNTCGYLKFSDFLYSTALAVTRAAKVFPKVQMVSDEWGVEMFKKIKLPVTEYSTALDDIHHVSKHFWAYAKLVAYTMQYEPFVHIDQDVFLFEPLPDRILNAELCFQSKEDFDSDNFPYYKRLLPSFMEAPVKPKKIIENIIHDFAYNCGICGGHNLDHFRELRECAEEYIFAKKNYSVLHKKYDYIVASQNLMFEQYFNAVLARANGCKVEVIGEDVPDVEKNMKYTHVWGLGKHNMQIMAKVMMKLIREDLPLFQRITDFLEKYKIK